MLSDEAVIAHEAAHATVGLLCGLEVTRVDVIGTKGIDEGFIQYVKGDHDPRIIATVLMANGAPPHPPNARAYDRDVAHLRDIVDAERMDALTYGKCKVHAQELLSSPKGKALQAMLKTALDARPVLNEADIRSICTQCGVPYG